MPIEEKSIQMFWMEFFIWKIKDGILLMIKNGSLPIKKAKLTQNETEFLIKPIKDIEKHKDQNELFQNCVEALRFEFDSLKFSNNEKEMKIWIDGFNKLTTSVDSNKTVVTQIVVDWWKYYGDQQYKEYLKSKNFFRFILLNISGIILAIGGLLKNSLTGLKATILKSFSSVPNISKETEVIEWFIKNDNKIKDLKKWYSAEEIKEFEGFVLKDIEENNSREKLGALLNLFEKQYNEILPKAASSFEINQKIKRPLTREEEVIFLNIMKAESFLAAKMRILGYFLLKKYEKNPLENDINTQTGKSNVSISYIGKSLGEGINKDVWVMSLGDKKPMFGLNINISKRESYLILLALKIFEMNQAMISENLIKLMPKKTYKKIVDYLIPIALRDQKYFGCEISQIDECTEDLNKIINKLHEVWDANINSQPAPHWYLSKTVFSLLNPSSKVPDVAAVHAISGVVHAGIMNNIEFWENVFKKCTIVPD